MTKEERIQESYGKYWEGLSIPAKNCALKHNGYIGPIISNLGEIPRDFVTYDNLGFRPISLIGIENNNGWNLIEDLDIEDNEYVLFLRHYEGEGEPPIFTSPLSEDFEDGYFTHWKRIDISKSPLF